MQIDDAFVEVASNVTDTNYTQSVNTTGDYYQFRVTAINSVGNSDYSSDFSIIAATKPEDAPNDCVRDESLTN